MQPSQQPSRINLQELKAQMIKKIGPDKARKYFDYFRSYINMKSNKTQIDKQIILTIGKENIALHNQIIKAVLSNAIHGEVPPPALFVQGTSRAVKRNCEKPPVGKSFDGNLSVTNEVLCTNRSNISKERSNVTRSGAPDNNINNVNVDRLSWKDPASSEQSETNLKDVWTRLGKRPRNTVTYSVTDTAVDAESNLSSIDKSEAFHQERNNQLFRPPIGVQSCSASVHGAKRSGLAVMQLCKIVEADFLEADKLPDIVALQRYMECMAVSEGLDAVNEDGVRVLQQGLDAFLKQVISNCINYIRSKSDSQMGHQVESQDMTACDGCKPTTAGRIMAIAIGKNSSPVIRIGAKLPEEKLKRWCYLVHTEKELLGQGHDFQQMQSLKICNGVIVYLASIARLAIRNVIEFLKSSASLGQSHPDDCDKRWISLICIHRN